MSYKAWFTEETVVGERFARFGRPQASIVKEGVLFFHLRSDSLVENSPQTEFDDMANEEHKKKYSTEYAEFLKSKEVAVENVKATELPERVEPLEVLNG